VGTERAVGQIRKVRFGRVVCGAEVVLAQSRNRQGGVCLARFWTAGGSVLMAGFVRGVSRVEFWRRRVGPPCLWVFGKK
jgi:hypothetical protein